MRELRRATDEMRRKNPAKTGRKRAQLAAELAEMVSRANRLLDRAVGRKAAPKASLFAHRGDDQAFVLDVRGIPHARAAAAFKALASAARQP